MLGMTRKHFEAFASIIQSTREQCSDAPETVWAIDHIRDEMADYFQGENPKFRPRALCGGLRQRVGLTKARILLYYCYGPHRRSQPDQSRH